jgi:hypothetical protein
MRVGRRWYELLGGAAAPDAARQLRREAVLPTESVAEVRQLRDAITGGDRCVSAGAKCQLSADLKSQLNAEVRCPS